MITAEEARSIFEYDRGTGLLYWKEFPKRCRRRDEEGNLTKLAGTQEALGYWVVRVKGKFYKAHRLIWLMEYGEWPKERLDHIDRNRINNRISNLRESSAMLNGKNKSKHRNNSSGTTGIGECTDRVGWYAKIRTEGSLKFKRFKTREEAEAWRKDRELEHGFSNG